MKTILILGQEEKEIFEGRLSAILEDFDVEYLIFHQVDLEKIKTFDYTIINSNYFREHKGIVSEYCFVNMDKYLDNELQVSGNLITYGFGNKNSVTVSSVENENMGFVYCLQRYINTDSSRMLEPQEIPVNNVFDFEMELYSFMVGITIGLMEGKYSYKSQQNHNPKKIII